MATGTIWASVPAQYQSTYKAAAAKYGIRPEMLAAVGKIESGFNPSARSGAGAIGIQQFMPATAASYGVNPLDPTSSIYGSAHYLSDLQKQYGSETRALSAYNSGSPTASPGYAATVLAAAGSSPVAAPGTETNTAVPGAVGASGTVDGGGGIVGSIVSGIFAPFIEFGIEAGMVIGGAALLIVGGIMLFKEVG